MTKQLITGLDASQWTLPGPVMLYGTGTPDDALVSAPVGSRYFQNGTSIEWYKYGPNAYNWRPIAMDLSDGFIYDRIGSDQENGILDTVGAAGGGAVTASTGAAGRVGIYTSTVTATVTPDRVRTDNIKGAPLVLGGGKFYFFGSVRMATVSDGTDNISVRLFGNDISASADATNGVYFENDRQVYGDNNWRGKTAAGGSRSVVDLGATSAPVSGTWQKLGIVVAADGLSASFLVDDVLLGTLSTNLPTAGFAMATQTIKTLGSSARSAAFDYMYCAALCAAGR